VTRTAGRARAMMPVGPASGCQYPGPGRLRRLVLSLLVRPSQCLGPGLGVARADPLSPTCGTVRVTDARRAVTCDSRCAVSESVCHAGSAPPRAGPGRCSHRHRHRGKISAPSELAGVSPTPVTAPLVTVLDSLLDDDAHWHGPP
jgi:hypothetical protein